MTRRLNMLVPLLGLLLVFYGCAKPAPKCVAPEDNPRHHYLRGMELIEKNRIADASAKFDRALYCEDGYSPAHSGLAITEAVKASGGKDEGRRKVDYDRAFEHLKSAYKSAQTPEDEFAHRVASIRVHTILKPKNWLSDAEKDYSRAMKLKTDDRKLIYYDGKEAATYFMGMAWLDGREFQKARDSFSAVLSAKREGRWNEPADRGWKKTDKIVRAIGGITLGDVGKEIAVKDSVTRGDMAALLVDEVKIEKLFAGRIPVKSAVDRMKPEFTPADVLESQFKEETLAMMKWGVRGLEPSYDNTTKAFLFRPGSPVSRKEFALVIEDVLIKLAGDETMASAFLGHGKSPFPDVQPTSAWYNAIMNVTTRNLMETELSGEFRPEDTVDGAEAMLAIRVLRQRLNIY